MADERRGQRVPAAFYLGIAVGAVLTILSDWAWSVLT